MNTEEIFKRYTEATNKSRAVKEMADEYGVAGSDIVCELFKTGYKLKNSKEHRLHSITQPRRNISSGRRTVHSRIRRKM